jgi:hypothetical protein
MNKIDWNVLRERFCADQEMKWHIKFLIFDFLCAFDRSSFETKKPKFSAHLDVL